MLLEYIVTVIIILCSILFYLKGIKPLAYWKYKGVVYKKPVPFLGNMVSTFFRRKAMAYFVQDMYNEFAGHRYY